MEKIVKNNSGITLMALVITIIVLIILAAIGIGSATGMKGSINESKETVAITDLSKIQQVVLENYIKFKQMNQEKFLKGEPITFAEAKTELDKLGYSGEESLKVTSYVETDPTTFYYKLNTRHLKEMGLQNIGSENEYIVNYSTGEVFNIKQKKTSSGHILYVYSKDIN